MTWDDLRFFLELARSGTLTAAARRLGVEHTTVARRVNALEGAVGGPLFERSSREFTLTESGKRLLPTAAEMERAFSHVALTAETSASRLAGRVRIGCSEGYGSQILPRHLAQLNQQYPEIEIDLLAFPRAIQLSRNEADLVITIDRPVRGPYTIVKLADYSLGLYAAEKYLVDYPDIVDVADLRDHPLIAYVDYLLVANNLPVLDPSSVRARRGIHSTSIIAQKQAAMAGAGLVILPRYMARGEPSLRPVLQDRVSFARTYWLVSPVELKALAPVRAVSAFLRKMAKLERL